MRGHSAWVPPKPAPLEPVGLAGGNDIARLANRAGAPGAPRAAHGFMCGQNTKGAEITARCALSAIRNERFFVQSLVAAALRLRNAAGRPRPILFFLSSPLHCIHQGSDGGSDFTRQLHALPTAEISGVLAACYHVEV